jgi:hypothetical protein
VEKRDRFLSRFYACQDGVLRAIRMVFSSAANRTDVIVTLSVRDARGPSGQDWVNVRVKIRDVAEVGLRESSQVAYQVLSQGVHIGLFEQLSFFDFDPYTLEPGGVEDDRRSRFYFAGRDFAWRVEPYRE